jgi:hypothetical protein
LAQIWTGQEVLGLILASVFAITVNAALISQWVWLEAATPSSRAFLYLAGALSWLFSMIYTIWWSWRCHPEQHRAEVEKLIRDALQYYLQGRWNEARLCCEQVLCRDESDADALMQLGMIHLRAGHPTLARQTFRQCLETEAGSKWRWEINQVLRNVQR